MSPAGDYRYVASVELLDTKEGRKLQSGVVRVE